jgi:hypothetical protein
MSSLKNIPISSKFKFKAIIKDHLFHGISITNSYLRMGSESWCELVNFYRENKSKDLEFSGNDKIITDKLETGKPAYYKDRGHWVKVKLDLPSVDIHKGKRFKVYRRTAREHEGLPVAKIIRFGSSADNLQIKNDDKSRSDSFWARHKCDLKKDKNTAGWWACYAPELFGDILKLKGGKNRW